MIPVVDAAEIPRLVITRSHVYPTTISGGIQRSRRSGGG